MTVRELIKILEDYDDDMEVVIGMHQRYGSDFAKDICEVEEYEINNWYDDDDVRALVITEGSQIGTVHYED